MLESIQGLREEVCTILDPWDMRGVDCLQVNEVSDKMPANVNMF